MMTDKLITQVDPAWQQAMNDLADEKQALRDMLDNLVTLWSFEAPLAEMESAMLRASVLLVSTRVED
jgi:transcription termination factor NusB